MPPNPQGDPRAVAMFYEAVLTDPVLSRLRTEHVQALVGHLCATLLVAGAGDETLSRLSAFISPLPELSR